jgi:hypothetical protein
MENKTTKKPSTPKKTQEKQVKKTNKKKMNKMDLYLLIDLSLIVIFTSIMIWVYLKTFAVPDSVVVAVYGILGGECGLLAMIKNRKEAEETRRMELEDRKYFEKMNKEKGDE